MEIKQILRKSPSNTLFRNEIHSLLRLDDAPLTSLTVFDAYRYFVGR